MVIKNSFKRFILITIFIFTTIYSNNIETKAYKAYKSHNYKEALYLYKEGAKEKNLKSLFMLGFLVERGLGIKANKNKAIKLYKLVIKNMKYNEKTIKNIDIVLLALKRLVKLTNNSKYNKLINKLNSIKASLLKKEKRSLNLYIDDYFAMCPAAKVVNINDAEGITNIDCELFQNFPDRMARFMKLKSARAKAIEAKDQGELYSIEKKIIRTIRPILKYIEQQTIECYNSANYFYDVRACDYNYLTQTDPLLFENRAYKMEQAIAKQDSKDYKIEPYEKEKLINALIYQFSTQDYDKKSYRMVKL
jgi:hypothetical protein